MNSPNVPDISIVIPFHDAVGHLARCMDSVLQQDGPILEVLCVDDASRDESAALVKQYQQSDSRVRLLSHERNRGAGAARNTGLDEACGDYVMFVDADDTFPTGALLHLFALASANDSDLVKGAYEEVLEQGEIKVARWSSSRDRVCHTRLAESGLLQTIPGPHCSYLFRRELLDRGAVRYPTDLILGEDLVFVAQALLVAEKVTLTPEVVYRYHRSRRSLSSRVLTLEALLAAIEQKQRIAGLMSQQGLEELAVRHLSRWDHQLREYWPRMAATLPIIDCRRVFRAIRKAVPPGVTPWNAETPAAFRSAMAHIMRREDEAAFDALRWLSRPSLKARHGQGETLENPEFRKVDGDASKRTRG